MKKLLSCLLILVLSFMTFGCSGKGTYSEVEKIEHDVDVVKEASLGRIPEVEFLLGDPIDGVQDALFEKSAGMTYNEFCQKMIDAGYTPDGSEYSSYIMTNEVGGRTILSANFDTYSTVYCMYNTENKDSGIAAIAVGGEAKAYGFDTNTLMDYVKGAVDAEAVEEPANSELSFLPKEADGATRLVYEIGDYKLELYFTSYNTLAATVLYNMNIW